VSEPDDQVDLNVLKAPLPPRHQVDAVRSLRFQMLGYATALAVLIVLTPTWLIRDFGRSGMQLRSGLGMVRDGHVLGGLGNYLFIAYVVLALVALVCPATIAGFACAYAGLADTIVIVLLKPDGSDYAEIGWTGAPALALGLWLALAFINHIGWYDARR
jgi:hypothetical protein